MIKICDKSLLNPLIILFQNLTKSFHYPQIWKKSTIISVHKKNDQQLAKNYRPISFLTIFGKLFGKIIFIKFDSFLLRKELRNPSLPGLRPSDYCVNELISITQELFEAFDCNLSLEVRQPS